MHRPSAKSRLIGEIAGFLYRYDERYLLLILYWLRQSGLAAFRRYSGGDGAHERDGAVADVDGDVTSQLSQGQQIIELGLVKSRRDRGDLP